MKVKMYSSLVFAFLLVGCASPEPVFGPVSMEVRALGTGECGPASGSVVNPFADMTTGRVIVRGIDPVDGEYKTLINEARSLTGDSMRVLDVPEGVGHDVEFIGTGGAQTWYAKDPNVTVRKDEDNAVELLLTLYGGFSQVPVDTSFTNVIFPAVTEIGDGRIMISGGFQSVLPGGDKLAAPSKQYFIYNPKTGQIDAKGVMPDAGRGAHTMVYIPTTNQVLIVGGASELNIRVEQPFPLEYEKSRGLKQALLFDLPSGDAPSGKFVDINSDHAKGNHVLRMARVFPRALVLSDGLVAVTGGGEWPNETDPDYDRAELFDAQADEGQGTFISIASFNSFAPRTGHTLNFIKTQDGVTYGLVYGGTTPGHPIAEVLRQSRLQNEGADGHFMELTIDGDTPAYTFFHQVTPLSGLRFLVTGGVRYDATTKQLKAPEADEAYLLTYSDNAGSDPRLNIKKLPGMGAGRVFHTAVTSDYRRVAIIGGFNGLDALDTDKIVFFDVDNATEMWRLADESGNFLGRGGQGGLMQPSGAALLVGGESALKPKGSDACGYVELYTPSNTPIP